MATRATYKFKDNGWSGTDVTVYIHHDGYPSGAAEYFRAACESGRQGVEGFIAANERAEITRDHSAHGDTDYRYTVRKGQLEVEARKLRTNGDMELVESWETIYEGTIADFIRI